MQRLTLPQIYKREFKGYTFEKFFKDLFAGLTVAAVALPLALAFGVASGATAAAGMVTAIVGGLLIGIFSGAPYQISGPTGAMSAILIVLAQRYGMEGVWIAGFFSGILLLLIGALRWGRVIGFIPAPVITGFTSGIALIIAVGQIDNFFGIHTPATDSAASKLIGYLNFDGSINPHSLLVGCGVIAMMTGWPKAWNNRFPSALLGILVATICAALIDLDVSVIGDIPPTLILDERLSFSRIEWNEVLSFAVPILSITALGAVESLLCGAVASNMTGIRLQTNQELIAQGLGNIVIPFFGGVPATAAIARTSVGIKAGGITRLVGIIHALTLLAAVFLLAPVISKIPLSALAGVLIVTAFRMNEWEQIHFYFSRKLYPAILKFAVTFAATITLDLTYAILIGVAIAAVKFLNDASEIKIEVEPVDHSRLRRGGVDLHGDTQGIRVAYITGPLFFGATGHFVEAFNNLSGVRALILSVRGMPLIDSSGTKAVHELWKRLQAQGARLYFAGIQKSVRENLERAGVAKEIGEANFFWTSAEAIVAAQRADLQ